jgi:hypothetical protein
VDTLPESGNRCVPTAVVCTRGVAANLLVCKSDPQPLPTGPTHVHAPAMNILFGTSSSNVDKQCIGTSVFALVCNATR